MNEPRSAILRLVASGGRTCENPGAGPSGSGSVCIGTRTLSESGSVGDWQREQVELFCISKLVNCVIEASDEMIFMDIHFPVSDGGIEVPPSLTLSSFDAVHTKLVHCIGLIIITQLC